MNSKLRTTLSSLFLIPGVAFSSNGYVPVSQSAKALGMAGTGIGIAQDALSLNSNPALLVWLQDRVDVVTRVTEHHIKSERLGSDNPQMNGVYTADRPRDSSPAFGLVRNLGQSIAVGAALFEDNGMRTYYDTNSSQPPGNFPLSFGLGSDGFGINRRQTVHSVGAAFKLNEVHAVGLTIEERHQQYTLSGMSDPVMCIPEAASCTQPPASRTAKGRATGVRLGWIMKATEGLGIGAQWSSKVSGHLVPDGTGNSNTELSDSPPTYGVGVSMKLTPSLTIAADYSVAQFGKDGPSAEQVRTRFSNPNLATQVLQPTFGWADLRTTKLGLTYAVKSSLDVRLGYSRSNQVIARSDTYINMVSPAVIKQRWALGATWKPVDHMEVSLAYVRGKENTVYGLNSIPVIIYGPRPIPNFYGKEANISMADKSLGLSLGWLY